MIPPLDGVAIVTGGASGIGAEIAASLTRAGARVVIGDVDRAGAAAVAAAHPGMLHRELDVTDPGSIHDFVGWFRTEFDAPPRYLVHSAGWGIETYLLEHDRELVERVIAVNLTGVIELTRAVLDEVVGAGAPAAIVTIGSDAGRSGVTRGAVYAAAKAGVIGFTKSVALEFARRGVRANVVSPGPVDTPLLRKERDEYLEGLIRAVPLRRLGTPGDIAQATTYLLSDAAQYITGQVLSVNGGITMVD